MKKKQSVNYLDKIPVRNEAIKWKTDDDKVTLMIENTGVFNRIAQKLLKKPKISYIHLDEMGSFLWPVFSDELTVSSLGNLVEEKFGEAAHPLYERLIKYVEILRSYNFIIFKDELSE